MEFYYQKHNPWWEDAHLVDADIMIREFNAQLIRYHHPFLKTNTSKPGVTVIRGPRRIGKTTLLKLFIQQLIRDEHVSGEAIFFYPCNRITNHNELYDLIVGYLGQFTHKYRYIILDEITFVKDWQRTIKDLWDSGDLQTCRVILTGSNALDLKYSSERLPGRRGTTVHDIMYSPLSFRDFSQIVHKYQPNREQQLHDFMICGGFPQAINEYYRSGFIPNFLYETYLSWIEGDIHSVGKSENTMYAICSQIMKHMGSTTSWYTIAKNTGIGSHSTVNDYIDILEKIYASFVVPYYSIDQDSVNIAKNKKIYWTDPIIFHALRAKIDGFVDSYFTYSQEFILNSPHMPVFIENLVGADLYKRSQNIFYGEYRGKEIDFLVKTGNGRQYYEVKNQTHPKVSDFHFWDKPELLTVITPAFTFQKNSVTFIPLGEWLKKVT